MVRDLKDPPTRLLDQARVRDGAFDIGMFRSYWEKATKRTGERIADLSARPLQQSNEAPAPVSASEAIDEVGGPTPSGGSTPSDEPPHPLSTLITRVLESADQLAASTRKTWKGTKVSSGESGPADSTPE